MSKPAKILAVVAGVILLGSVGYLVWVNAATAYAVIGSIAGTALIIGGAFGSVLGTKYLWMRHEIAAANSAEDIAKVRTRDALADIQSAQRAMNDAQALDQQAREALTQAATLKEGVMLDLKRMLEEIINKHFPETPPLPPQQ